MATEAQKLTYAEVAAPSTPASGKVVTYAKSDGLMYAKDDAGTETLLSGGVGAAAHIADTSDAHDASAVSFTPAGTIAATDVQAAIEEVAAEAGGGATVATDTIWDAKGDLAVGTGANTAAKLTVGANGAIPIAASGETTGMAWLRVIRGRVNADGTEASDPNGAFTSAKNSTGDYTVTFGSAFGAAPFAFVTADSGGGSRKSFVTDVTTGDMDLFITNFAGSNTDTPFDFIIFAV